MPISDSQGNNFIFVGNTYTVTAISISYGGDVVDVTGLNVASGGARLFQGPILKSTEVQADFLSNSPLPTIGQTGTFTAASVSGKATVSAVSLAYAVGDLVKGSVTLKTDA